MPGMGRPVQRQRRQVEYATKADVEILAAEVHGFREATDAQIQGFREATAAEIRGLRESTKADVEVLAAEIRGLREATDAQIQGLREATDARLDRIERQIERMAADHRATVRWIVGSALALGALMMAMLRFGQTGVG